MVRGCIPAIRRRTFCVPAVGLALLTAPAWGANWTDYESGPFRVISDAGAKAARARLEELDQLRHTLGAYLGKDDLETVWPIEIALFENQREYGPHALPQPLVEGPDANLGAWMTDTALPHDLLREITRQLIEDNAGRMPQAVEQALIDLMATIQVKETKGIKVTVGTAPAAGELSAERMRAWAKLQMLAALPEFNGKLRVYLNNLQQGGDEDLAAHNAFGLTAAELDQRAAAYFAAGNFAAVPAPGDPINPDRDFDQQRVSASDIDALFVALKAAGKEFPPDSPRGLLKQGTRPELELAAKANPKWAEPHEALASFYADPEERVKELKLAATLNPRNSAYWQALAMAQEDAFQYADADKSWKLAERNAVGAAEKAQMHREGLALEQRRVQAEIEDRKHQVTDTAEDLERVKQAADARIRAAEEAADRRNGALTPGTKVVPWWSDEDGHKLSGKLTNVDCQKDDAVRLTIQPATGAPVKLMIRDLHNLAVKGADQARFACGVQKPAKAINLVHDGMPDVQQGTVGNVRTVELP